MASVLDQIMDAGSAAVDNIKAQGEYYFGDLGEEEYWKRIHNNQTRMREPFLSDEKIYGPENGGNKLYNEYTLDELEKIRQSLVDPEGAGTYYEIDFPQGLYKSGITEKSADLRHPWYEVGGGKITREDKMRDFAYFERLVNGNKYMNEKKAYGKNAVPKGHDTEFYDLGLDGGFSEVYFRDNKTQEAKIKGMSTAVAELDNDQLDTAQVAMDTLKRSFSDGLVEPQAGNFTRKPSEANFNVFTLKQQEEQADKLAKMDEEKGTRFSPRGSMDYEEILKSPAMEKLALDTYKDIKGEDISDLHPEDKINVLKGFASEQSNNISKMLWNMASLDSRKARRLSAFLKAYRSSNLSAGQVARGVVETALDPTTYITGGAGALAAKPIIKEGMKKAIAAGAVDSALTGLTQSIAEQSREVTAGHQKEISGKEVAKHMTVAMLLGTGMSAAMQKIAGKKVADLPEEQKKEVLEEYAQKPDKDESGFSSMFSRMGEEDNKKFETMFSRMGTEEPEQRTDLQKFSEGEGVLDIEKVKQELEADKEHPEPRQKISAKEEEKKEDKDEITYRNRVMNMVTQRLLPETKEAQKRDVPITSKPISDEYEYQTQGRLSGKELSEKANRAAELISIEEGSIREFTKQVLEAENLKEKAPKKGEHPLAEDLRKTNVLIDSLNGRRYVLEESGRPLIGKALDEHMEAVFDLRNKRDELQKKMQKKDVETIAKREYGKQFEEKREVEPFNFTTTSKQEIDNIVKEKVDEIEKRHKWMVKPERLEKGLKEENVKEVETFLENTKNELNTRIQQIETEKSGIQVSTTKLANKEKQLLNDIARVEQDRRAGMPDNLYKAELIDIFMKNEKLDYNKNLTQEAFEEKKAKAQVFMKNLGLTIRDANPVEEKQKEKVSYKDRKVTTIKDTRTEEKKRLDKVATDNKWIYRKPEEKKFVLQSILDKETTIGAEEKSWGKILEEALDKKIITRREAEDIVAPNRIEKGIDRGIYNYNKFRAEKIAKLAEEVNKKEKKQSLGIELGEVKTGEVISATEARDAKFSNLQLTSALMGDEKGFKAVGAWEGFTEDARVQIGKDALEAAGISQRAMKRIEGDVKTIAKLALGNRAYTEGEISVVRKLLEYFQDKNIKTSTEQMMKLYKAINDAAEKNNAGVLLDYAKTIQDAVNQGRIEPVIQYKNFDGKLETVKVYKDTTEKQRFLSEEYDILKKPTLEDAQAGKVAALITQSVDAFVERQVRKEIGYKGTASVFDAFITANKKDLDKINRAVKNAMQEINEKGGLSYILNQIDPEGNYPKAKKIDFSKVKEEKLLDKELETGGLLKPVKKLESVESFLMSDTGAVINHLLEGSITSKKGIAAIRESVNNALRIVEHTPEQIAEYKRIGFSEEQIGKRSDLEYSKLDKLAGEVIKSSTKEEILERTKKYKPEGITRAQSKNWDKALEETAFGIRKTIERKKGYEGKRLFIDKNGEEIDSGRKSLKQFFNELSEVDEKFIGLELSELDKVKEFVRSTETMRENNPTKQAVEAKNMVEEEKFIVKATDENKENILKAHAIKEKVSKGKVELPEGIHDRYQKNKKLKEDTLCAN